MRLKKILTSIILLLIGQLAYAGNAALLNKYNIGNSWSFLENKGQLSNANDLSIKDIKFYGRSGGVDLYCKPGSISFLFSKIADGGVKNISEASLKDVAPNTKPLQNSRNCAINKVDLVLLNSNQSAKLVAGDEQEYYENFYLPSDNNTAGITHVGTYKTLTYQNIYPKIDLVLHCKKGGLKYEFVVHPGGNIDDIQIQWNGLRDLKLTDRGGIVYSILSAEPGEPIVNAMQESKPVCFQGSHTINSCFLKTYNRIGFRVKNYNKTKTLIIDPDLIWGTYYGGGSLDQCMGIAIDKNNNVYISGVTSSASGIATSGSYQSVIVDSFQGFLVKFNSNGQRIWATYYGYANTFGNNITIDLQNNLCIAGSTNAKLGLATAGTYQTSISGGYDCFISKFKPDGTCIWSTFFGGKKNDYSGSIALDVNGNIFISGESYSISGIATTGAFQTIPSGSSFLAKFSQNGQLIWATFYEGYIHSIACDIWGNVYITGYTWTYIGLATPGAYQYYAGTIGGTIPPRNSGFLTKFNGSGARIWATYFGDTDYGGETFGNGIVCDALGNIYFTGLTTSPQNIATTGAYKTSISGNGDAFVAKFDSSGAIIWSTYFGGEAFDEFFGIAINDKDGIYITGSTNSNINIATTGAYQSSRAGDYDIILAKFSLNGVLQWSTYYGGPNRESPYWNPTITLDKFKNIYICGGTRSLTGIATPSAFQKNWGGASGYDSTDGFIAKFGDIHYDAGITTIVSPGEKSCKDSGSIMVDLKNFGHNNLSSVDINFNINGQMQKPYHWIGNLKWGEITQVNLGKYKFRQGADTITSWSSLPNGMQDSFPTNDTATSIINVYPLPNPSAGADTILCFNQSYTMHASGGITYKWTPATYLNSDTIARPITKLPHTQRYTVTVSNNFGCIDSATVVLKVRPKLKVIIKPTPEKVCYGSLVSLFAIGSGGDSMNYSYTWPNDSQNIATPQIKIVAPGWHKVLLNDNCTPTAGIDSIYIDLFPHTKAEFTWTPPIFDIVNRPIHFLNTSQNASSYLWGLGDNHLSKEAAPLYTYSDTGIYKIYLVAYSSYGCANDTSYKSINIIDGTIAIYIPNSFSPNGDGINDIFDINGMGIKSYSYNIYNRWGEHIFYSGENLVGFKNLRGLSGGWDGKFKGAPVPDGVYLYQMDIIDIDGYHHYMSGTVTISR